MAHEHDHFFRHVFGDPANAAGELRAVLPAEISAVVDWSTLRLEDGAFVDEELRERRTDLLFSARLAQRPAYFLVLLEHKSRQAPMVALDVLGYMVRAWERHRVVHGGAVGLPPILPVVACHDERPWSAPTSFRALLDVDGALAPWIEPYLVDFDYAVDDLTAATETQLRARSMLALAKVALLCLKLARSDPDMGPNLWRWSDLLREIAARPTGVAEIHSVLTYILQVSETPAEQIRGLTRALGPKIEEAVMTTAERLRQEGEAQGEAKGQLKAKADALLQVLAARELSASETERARVFACTDLAILDRWIRRAATATSISEVFAQEQ